MIRSEIPAFKIFRRNTESLPEQPGKIRTVTKSGLEGGFRHIQLSAAQHIIRRIKTLLHKDFCQASAVITMKDG